MTHATKESYRMSHGISWALTAEDTASRCGSAWRRRWARGRPAPILPRYWGESLALTGRHTPCLRAHPYFCLFARCSIIKAGTNVMGGLY